MKPLERIGCALLGALFVVCMAVSFQYEPLESSLLHGECLNLKGCWTLESETCASFPIPEELSGAELFFSLDVYWEELEVLLRDGQGEETTLYTHSDPWRRQGTARVVVNLPEGAQGQTLAVRVAPESRELFQALLDRDPMLGCRSAVARSLLTGNFYALIFFAFCLALAPFLLAGILRVRRFVPEQTLRYLYDLLWIVLDGGVWILTDSKFLLLFTDRLVPISTISTFSFALLPVLQLRFVRHFLPREHKPLAWMERVLLAVLAAELILWLWVPVDSRILLPFYHCLIVLAMVATLRAILQELRESPSESVRTVLQGVCAFALASLVSIILFYSWQGAAYALCYCLALGLFLYSLGKAALRQAFHAFQEQATVEMYKRLALRDSLTGLGNRTAFNAKKALWSMDENWAYVMMDLNELKQVNDRYGHDRGNRLLQRTAQYILQAFQPLGDCYRIGGDEFIAVFNGKEQEEIREAVGRLRELTNRKDEALGATCSIAVGCAFQNGRAMTAEELFREADEKMYEDKKETKLSVNK